jgi:hypothetical protein
MSLRVLAIVLIVAGALTLAYPVINYTTRETVAEVGPLELTADRDKSVAIPPILGGIALAVGIGLLLVKPKR